MELSHLISLIDELPQNSKLSYVRSEDVCTYVKVDKVENRLYAVTPKGKECTFAESFLRALASGITPNVAFNTSQLLNNKGSNRAVVDSIIANTAEFYWFAKDSAKYTVWIPTERHTVGELAEWTDMDSIKMAETVLPGFLQASNYTPSPNVVRDSFIRFWTIVDQHGADYEAYVSQYEDVINACLQENADVENIFSITELQQYKKFIDTVIEKNAEMAYLQKENGPDGKKYLVYSTHKHYIEFLQILSATNCIKVSLQALNIKPGTKGFSDYRPYITAIKSKPFLLLAGISGTGKSRIVRELARACWEEGSEEYKAQKPRNFDMVQVKPNWHDSSELIGYVSRVSGKAEFVAGDFLKFVAKAWEDQDTPYFLCLDEMNLAPVEQYFAEYLSVVESRKCGEDGVVTTDPILNPEYEAKRNEKTGELEPKAWYKNLVDELLSKCPTEKLFALTKQFMDNGICIPQNLIVVGTVNMDETTFSFSRKVLDRAMTIEMNDVNLHGGLTKRHESIGKLGNAELVGSAVEGVDVYSDYTSVCDTALGYLQKVNDVLEGTPFKIAYRTRNEFLLYVVNNLPYNKDKDGNDLPQGYVIARALDEITSMKILSRIEGDDTKVSIDKLLTPLTNAITDGLNAITDEDHPVKSVSVAKLNEMKNRLQSGYTSFWS